MAKILNVNDAAKIIGLKPNTVRIKIRAGEIPCFFKLAGGGWRVKEDDLMAWIEELKNKQKKVKEKKRQSELF